MQGRSHLLDTGSPTASWHSDLSRQNHACLNHFLSLYNHMGPLLIYLFRQQCLSVQQPCGQAGSVFHAIYLHPLAIGPFFLFFFPPFHKCLLASCLFVKYLCRKYIHKHQSCETNRISPYLLSFLKSYKRKSSERAKEEKEKLFTLFRWVLSHSPKQRDSKMSVYRLAVCNFDFSFPKRWYFCMDLYFSTLTFWEIASKWRI